ncbi:MULTISPECIES: arylmalonate decarboxylase [unclassified Gordonia (in: high G+C Gram-positive bacteria)]|uniref:maleate cis-trans isomerase family protein n=1 Tax=unclassified Gordonia (in: high G+C Gram-positive bacteria) TaxID=2657482 RepID=UPI001F0CEEC6|nr:arylmalonate decarboxylase [Gordonia sp. ABSL49_1]MCH5645318.1 arylmalonate decarboxylase [Gordonia sp. ABSL49_1]
MTNVVGSRAVFGVIVPSTNTVVEHDYWRSDIDGVAFRAGSMYIPHPVMDDNAGFEALLGQIRASIDDAVRDVLTAEPDRMVMGMSAETFWGGVDGNAAFEQRLRDRTGLPVTTGASSCRAALETLGARRIAVFSPYQPIADVEVGRFFTEAGFDVAAITGLRCRTAMDIARVDVPRLREVVAELDGPDVDAIVQVGTNLSFVGLADELEAELGKPVVAINSATLWHALRDHGIADQVKGCGQLLREY